MDKREAERVRTLLERNGCREVQVVRGGWSVYAKYAVSDDNRFFSVDTLAEAKWLLEEKPDRFKPIG